MSAREDRNRLNVANTAARMLAEEGLSDYAVAKRKAARLLGLSGNKALPTNTEIDEALQVYMSIYYGDEQRTLCRNLRQIAVELMEALSIFNPYLTGSVLGGQTTRFSTIDLLLYVDSAKNVEIFLINQGWSYKCEAPRDERVEAILHLSWKNVDVRLFVAPLIEERTLPMRGNRFQDRARIEEVRTLLGLEEKTS